MNNTPRPLSGQSTDAQSNAATLSAHDYPSSSDPFSRLPWDDDPLPPPPAMTNSIDIGPAAAGSSAPSARLPWDDPPDSELQPPVPGDSTPLHRPEDGETGQATSNKPLAYDLDQFLRLQTVPREYLLEPVLCRQGLAMIHAKRGVGKTFLALAMALTVASGGSLLLWSAPKRRRVLYIDGEMPAGLMQERLRALRAGLQNTIPPDHFRIINADCAMGASLNLSTEHGQQRVHDAVSGADLIVIDNLATLARYGKENEAESWQPMQEWLLSLRRLGKSVLLVHHSNKSGAQRGTSSREDVLDVVLSLQHPTDYEPSQGCRFVVAFEKARGIAGAEATSVEATMLIADGRATWSTRNVEDAVAAEVAELKAQGMSYREIAAQLHISKSAAERAYRRLCYPNTP